MIKTLLKFSVCNQLWREWERVRRFVFGQFNQWSFPNNVGGPIFYQFAWAWPVCRGRHFRAFPSERPSHSTFFFTPVLRSNANGIYTFSSIGDNSFQNLLVVKRWKSKTSLSWPLCKTLQYDSGILHLKKRTRKGWTLLFPNKSLRLSKPAILVCSDSLYLLIMSEYSMRVLNYKINKI